MKLLLSKIDNAPFDTLLTYFKVRRRDEQPEKEWTLYFSPWHKDRILRVSNENRLLAQVSNKRNGNSGQIKKGHIPWNKGLKLKEIV